MTRLAEDRKRAALSQVTVAGRMGVTQSRVAAIERANLDTLQIGTLRAYYRALDLDIDFRPTAAIEVPA